MKLKLLINATEVLLCLCYAQISGIDGEIDNRDFPKPSGKKDFPKDIRN